MPRDLTPSPSQPLSTESLRQTLLAQAGFDEADQVRILKKVLASAEAGLDATKETPCIALGQIVDIHKQPDHQARGKAREQLIDLIGVNAPTKSISEKVTPPSIPLAPWMKQITISNTSTTAETVPSAAVEDLGTPSTQPIDNTRIPLDMPLDVETLVDNPPEPVEMDTAQDHL